jgi:hypothetical protein
MMRELGYSRAAMLIGFVLGFSIEKNLYLAVELAGPYFILRPIPLALLLFTLGFLGYNIYGLVREKRRQRQQGGRVEVKVKNKGESVLQLCFITMLMVTVSSAFIAALTYNPHSAMAPLIILVPMILLTGYQFVHSLSESRGLNVGAMLSAAVRGHNTMFNNVAGFCGWIVFLLMLIFVAGHYAGIAAFMYILLNYIAREKTGMTLAIAAGVTLFIYLLFEQVLGMELYRGMIYRISAGYAY